MKISTKRPKFHFTPLRGWMNDPCAPYYDAAKGLYHIYYQWVPDSTEWSHVIGWGHAWTKDFLSWEADSKPSLMPEKADVGYDVQGVFTGNMDIRSVGQEKLVALYSAISEKAKLKDTLGYQNGQERIAIATSTDQGSTWTKDPENPLAVFPPPKVTGWRDPFIFRSPSLDDITKSSKPRTYCIIAGGIDDVGPTVFLYALPGGASPQDPDKLSEPWEYLGPLVKPMERPPQPRSEWTGDRGDNWECAGMFSLTFSSTRNESKGSDRQFLIVGSEGEFVHSLQDRLPEEYGEKEKPPMWQLWFGGKLGLSDRKVEEGRGIIPSKTPVELGIELEGVLDWGCLYATQVFDSGDGRTIMLGWLPDDDLTPAGRASQTWAGSFGIPRELFEQTLSNVTSGLQTPLGSLPGFEISQSDGGKTGKTVSTLGIRPMKEVRGGHRTQASFGDGEVTESASAWEAEMIVGINPDETEEIGLTLIFADSRTASIIFLPKSETILVRRADSIPPEDKLEINVSPEHGKHTLFKYSSGEIEDLHLNVFYDGTILEVFANERFALSTHLYGGECGVAMLKNGNEEIKLASAWYYA